jgi:hypothetical protein
MILELCMYPKPGRAVKYFCVPGRA